MSSIQTIAPQEKTMAEMNKNDRQVIGQLLQWQGKPLVDLSKGELIKCIIHLTAQVVSLQHKLDQVEIKPDGSKELVGPSPIETLAPLIEQSMDLRGDLK